MRISQNTGLWCVIVVLVPLSSPAQWVETAKLTALEPAGEEFFGAAVSLRADVAFVGATGDGIDGMGPGSVYVFRRTGRDWIQSQRILASDGAPSDGFGSSSVHGDWAVVGAPLDDDLGQQSGSVYVFRFDGTQWSEEQKLTASDGSESDGFGRSVALLGDTVFVGAWGDDDLGSASGSVYVFRRTGTEWVEVQKLNASDGTEGDLFSVVSAAADVLLVGASGNGSAYVFRFNGATWVEEQKLIPSQVEPGDQFGGSVSISGDEAVVGARMADSIGPNSVAGAAYVFRFDGASWVESQVLLASDGEPGDRFGGSVSIDEDRIVVGASYANQRSGSTYLFVFRGSRWVEEIRISDPDVTSGAWYGGAVSLSGDTVLVSARSDAVRGEDSGSVYVYEVDLTGYFKRGDVDGNGVASQLADSLMVLNYVFADGPAPDCLDAADANDNGMVNGLLDVILLLHYQFVPGGSPPPAPGPRSCGVDTTIDTLDCGMPTGSCP